MNPPREAPWPSLPLAEWQATHDTLHMWMQIVGKTRLALAPRQNHERQLSNFILPYEAVRGASSPDAAVLEFYQSAYDGAATLARWDRAALDRPPAEWP
jgi:hypothetical protein